jgi:hypothetical protein
LSVVVVPSSHSSAKSTPTVVVIAIIFRIPRPLKP